MKAVNSKVIISGNIVEVYEYEYPVFSDYQDERKTGRGSPKELTECEKEQNREKVLSRARKNLRRLINTNIGENSKFVTLTFAENVCDLGRANYEFEKFIKRLKYHLGKKVQYAVVPEFQKRGAVHYHVVFFNIGYIPHKELSNLWGQGYVKINRIEQVDNVGAYVCKYLTKDNVDERLTERKSYFCSRGLDKPNEMKEKEQIENLVHSLPAGSVVYENSFTTEHLGVIKYKQFNLNK